MGAGVFHGRVRDGIGCRLPAMATRSSNPPSSGLRRISVNVTGFGLIRAFYLRSERGAGGAATRGSQTKTENECAFDSVLDGLGWMIAVQDGVV
jgi:hypothetical protein